MIATPALGQESEGTPGKKVYDGQCSSCHGAAGEGFRSLYPPLAGSRFLVEAVDRLPCIIRHGLRGEIKVGEKQFNQIMPGNERLTAADIAAVISYMQDRWGSEKTELFVEEWLEQCD